MDNEYLFEEIKKVSLSMFRKNFFGVYHGSISARTSASSFVISKKEAIFDELERSSLITLNLFSKDYRWNTSSLDTAIHEKIYNEIPEAKYIAYTMPSYVTSFTLNNSILSPVDHFGSLEIGEMEIYDPGDFDSWLSRAPDEIVGSMKTNSTSMVLVRGFGIISYDRDIKEMAKKIALIENSAKLIALSR